MADRLSFDTIEQTIHHRFEKVAAKFPQQVALNFDGEQITYQELNAYSNRVADAIIKSSDKAPARIGIFLEHGITQIVALLAIMKAGKAYVALDIYFPAERNQYMLNDAGCSLLISNNFHWSQAQVLAADIPLLNIDEPGSDLSSDNPGVKISPDDICFIIYTSGSTGQPKGVMHAHRGIVHYFKRFSEAVTITPDDKIAFYYSISFSAHTMPIFGALLNGSTLMIFDLKAQNLSEFAKWLRFEKISMTLMIPSTLRHFLAVLHKNFRLRSMHTLWLGGETLYRSDVDKVRQHLKKNARIINLYASTEAFFSRFYTITSDTAIKSNIVPIGYYVDGMDMTIVDEDLKRMDPNQTGEILISSPYLALGYWNKPEQTASDFSEDPENPGARLFRTSDLGYKQSDGCMVHVGRSDSMVKIRGYRVDLGEIENNLIQHKNVKEVAVMVKENPFGSKHIIAYVVARETEDLDFSYLKLGIIRMLPEYMIPSHFVQLDSLPMNEIGKLNKKAIPDPDWNKIGQDRDVIQPESPLEYELQEIFERILEVRPISMDDNILELGADSLRLFVAFDEIEKKYNKKLNIDSIIEDPTLNFIASEIGNSASQAYN